MIQVCARCGTRWNVRDHHRAWCPRCHGPLLAPRESRPAVKPTSGPTGTRAQANLRWIAVRPGPPPPLRPRPRPLGPTPRYHAIPRWGLVDRPAPPAEHAPKDLPAGASVTAVQATLLASAAVFALAAMAHILRYVLLLINRTTLLPPLIANASLLMGVLVSLAAIVAVAATAAVLTSWLIGRRAEAYRQCGQDDPRPRWALWAGCVVPIVNLVWAPVFVIELAHVERSRDRLRTPITFWWIAWIFATLISAWAIWTSSATEAQAVADNTVTVIIAYLAGLAVLVLVWRVFEGFVRRPASRPAHRWVIVPTDVPSPDPSPAPSPEPDDDDESAPAVESKDREPAA